MPRAQGTVLELQSRVQTVWQALEFFQRQAQEDGEESESARGRAVVRRRSGGGRPSGASSGHPEGAKRQISVAGDPSLLWRDVRTKYANAWRSRSRCVLLWRDVRTKHANACEKWIRYRSGWQQSNQPLVEQRNSCTFRKSPRVYGTKQPTHASRARAPACAVAQGPADGGHALAIRRKGRPERTRRVWTVEDS